MQKSKRRAGVNVLKNPLPSRKRIGITLSVSGNDFAMSGRQEDGFFWLRASLKVGNFTRNDLLYNKFSAGLGVLIVFLRTNRGLHNSTKNVFPEM